MISNRPLWTTLHDAGVDVLDMCHDAGLSPATLEKLNRDESVELSIIANICCVLGCEVEDVVKIVV
ncbi:MAG: helix-turn-helix transcriptional regulator [Oscillospiraceae bacterium]|jgi:DNA-binding Xre family transcriptional regulator|nr:helix-turn-helix transcriptional regulator [Oscillospiraceae bacterium]